MDTTFIKDLLVSLRYELIKYKLLVVVTFILVSFAVLGLGMVWPKSYTTSSLLYVDTTTIIEPLLRGRAEVASIDRTQKAIEMVGSRRIMERAVERLNQFNEGGEADKLRELVIKLRSSFEVLDQRNNHFRINFKSQDPYFSYEGINAIVDVLIEESNRQKEEESRSAFAFINQQVTTYKAQLEIAEEKLKNFKSENMDGTEAEVSGRVSRLRSDIENLILEIEETQERIGTTKAQLAEEERYQKSKGLIELQQARRQSLVEELNRLRLSYQETYPDIVSIKIQIQEIDDAIVQEQLGNSGLFSSDSEQIENPLHEELRKQLSTAEVDLRTQQRRKASLEALLKKEYVRAEKIVNNQAELSELTRDYDVIREVYEEMLQRKENARLSLTIDEQGQGVSYKVREPAVFPLQQTGLTFIHFALVGPILAILLPVGLLAGYIIIDPRLRSPNMLEDALPKEYEILGTIPHLNTPLAERLLRKDVKSLIFGVVVALLIYAAVALLKFNQVIFS